MMNLRSFFRPSALADYLGRNIRLAALFFFVSVVVLIILGFWHPLHAAEPETSDPSKITRDAVASLEAAKDELAPKLDELTAEQTRLKGEIDGTIGECRQIQADYLVASSRKSGAEGAVAALEEVSRNNPSVAERIKDQLEEARLLVTVHETEMGEAIARAETVEGEQNTLLARRDEVEAGIREIKDAVATLDEAIAELKPPTRLTVPSSIDWTVYSREPVSRASDKIAVDVPQIAACMVAGDL